MSLFFIHCITHLLFEVSCMYVCYLLFPINNNNNIARKTRVISVCKDYCTTVTHPQLILFVVVLERLKDVPHESRSCFQSGAIPTIPLLYQYRRLHRYIDRHFHHTYRQQATNGGHATRLNVAYLPLTGYIKLDFERSR